MLKKYLLEKNISVYKLAEKSNVPYTTLNELINGKKNINDCKIKTIENLSIALNLSIESLLKMFVSKETKLSNSWEDNKSRKFYFPVIMENQHYECNRIHPLKQKKINELYNKIKEIDLVEQIILFGSSVNIRCNNKSDIDLAVKLKECFFTKENQNQISEVIQEITDYNTDIVWLNSLDPNTLLYENIKNKGVIIYE